MTDPVRLVRNDAMLEIDVDSVVAGCEELLRRELVAKPRSAA